MAATILYCRCLFGFLMAITLVFAVDLEGRFETVSKPPSCPRKITHRSFSPYNGTIPASLLTSLQRRKVNVTNVFQVAHSQISHDGVQCTSNGTLIVVQSTGGLTGFESEIRACGRTNVSSGSFFHFFDGLDKVPTTAFNFSEVVNNFFGLSSVFVDTKIMAFGASSDRPRSTAACVYFGPIRQLRSRNTTRSCTRPCFPADATITLADGGLKRMDEIRLGDRVEVGPNLFSDVFMFTHKDRDTVFPFVEIHTAEGQILSLTSGHYLYSNSKLVVAGSVRIGDLVELGNGRIVPVSFVRSIAKRGLFNPQTVQGDIVVNGLRCSTYTTAVAPKAAHSLLLPLRALYRMFHDKNEFEAK